MRTSKSANDVPGIFQNAFRASGHIRSRNGGAHGGFMSGLQDELSAGDDAGGFAAAISER